MSNSLTFLQMHPIARELIGKIFNAVQKEVDELVAMDTSKMTFVERGRWSNQLLKLMKWLQKEFPEAEQGTTEGRKTMTRLRSPEEWAAEEVEIDAIFGFDKALNGRPESDPQSKDPPPSRSNGKDVERAKPSFSNGSRRQPLPYDYYDDPSIPVGPPIDQDAEVAEILRRIRPGNGPPKR